MEFNDFAIVLIDVMLCLSRVWKLALNVLKKNIKNRIDSAPEVKGLK